MNYRVIDGNEACALISYLFTEIAGIYPITPSSKMAELVEKYSKEGVKNIFDTEVKTVEMQSEAGSIGLVHGALQGGSFASTYTSSQGLLLMIPEMYKIAGELLPSVINVASRTVSTHALSIYKENVEVTKVPMYLNKNNNLVINVDHYAMAGGDAPYQTLVNFDLKQLEN